MPEPSPNDTYSSPLADRYASREMLEIWSPRRKFQTWRKIWLAVAEAQHEMGLPVTKEQVEELRANLEVTDEDIALARGYEAKLRHDVMSHVHAWGDKCPTARGIIHLGMTSQDVNDNCELLQLAEACRVINRSHARLMVALGDEANRWRAVPTLGFTHYQTAQPVTVGRRIAQWAHDLWETGDILPPRLRGLRGATGTQASFLTLLEHEALKVEELETRFIFKLCSGMTPALFGFNEADLRRELERLRGTGNGGIPAVPAMRGRVFALTGQTYPRVTDAAIISELGAIACVLHKIATDIRLLSNRKEIDEPFAKDQIGSSAMPYKRNPMRCERVCALARYVWNLVPNTYDTAATQWLERTLDDSANRRMVLPEAFLGLDACLNIMHNVISGLIVNEAMVRKNLMDELPFLATESMMMDAVKLGRDRQDVHEAIRKHSIEAGKRIKQEGLDNDLVERLRTEPLLEGVDIDAHLDPMRHVGLAVEQTERFLREVIDPIRENMDESDAQASDLSV